jgi:hypothetical protein
MNPKTTAVLFAVAAALAAFVFFYEIEGEQARVEAKAAENRLFPNVEQSQIGSISIRIAEAPEIRLERSDSRWQILAPMSFPADAFAADGVASAITQLMSVSEIEDPQPLEAYGLRANGTVVRFTVGEVERVLLLGNATPIDSNSYASIEGDSQVFTVASYQLSSFKKTAEELRDKKIMDFDPATVRRASIRWPGAVVVVERDDAGWKMLEPVEARSDADAIDGLLMNLSLLRSIAFVDHPGSDEETGLAPPQFEVEVELAADAEGSTPRLARIAVGGVDAGGTQRFVRGAVDPLYLISQESLDGFPRRVVEYRDRRLAEFAAEAAQRIELGFHSASGETVAIRMNLEEGGWTTDAGPVSPERIDVLVDVLSDLRADDILAEAFGPAELEAMKLDPPNTVLQVYADGDSSESLAEIHLGVSFGDGITARVAGRDTVYRIDAAVAEALPVDLDDFRERFVVQPDPTEATDPTEAEPEAVEGLEADGD